MNFVQNNGNIILHANNQHDFPKIQTFIVETLEAQSHSGRVLIIVRNATTPTLLLNIKATLWYFNGFSYPHLNSADAMADASNIVITEDIKYGKHKNFKAIICGYSNLTNEEVLELKQQAEYIYIIDSESNIYTIRAFLLKNQLVYKTYQPNLVFGEAPKHSYEQTQAVIDEYMPQNTNSASNNQNTNIISDNIKKNNSNIKMNKFYTDQDSENKYDKAIVIIKPSVLRRRLEFALLFKLTDLGIYTMRFARRKLPKEFWKEFYMNISDKEFYEDYCEYMASDYVGVVTVMAKDCIHKLRNAVGPTNPIDCKLYHLRAQFGIDINDNGIHASDSPESYIRESALLNNNKTIT